MCGIICSKKYMEYITEPSRVASSDLKTENIQQLSKWKNYLSNDQITRILNMVSAFGLDFYADTIIPDYKGLKKFGTIA
jgi:histidyl-tRNA synthetase